MVSLPIPDKRSPIRYKDIRWQEYNVGTLVSDLTGGRIRASHLAHLDPDVNSESLSRHTEWRPVFGQTGAAQGHLRKHGIQAGDIYLFFGLFQNVVHSDGKLRWDTHSARRHVLWGWLQIDEVLRIDTCKPSEYNWAKYHPHFHRNSETNNTLYIARRYLTHPGACSRRISGAGVFLHCRQRLMLTAPAASSPSRWELPKWFCPRDGKCPLTYHSDPSRWQRTKSGTRLDVVARGQEFILDTEEFPEAIEWLRMLLGET
jgi:hypothetical protein